MIHAYNELYLDDAMENMGTMLEYAVLDCKYDPDEFFGWFVSSEIAEQFGNGNPKYISGMSGIELARLIVYEVTGNRTNIPASQPEDRTPEYWTGWCIAYYQWLKGLRFEEMADLGFKPSKVMSMYILHEADLTKFVQEADRIAHENQRNRTTNLQRIRKARGMTQQELANASGVKLRMVQLYEQRKNDINNASAVTVQNLSRALGCTYKQLLEAIV